MSLFSSPRVRARAKTGFLARPRQPLRFPVALVVLGVFGVSGLDAQTSLIWDANNTTAGAQDGAGTWNTTNANWYNGSADMIWPNDSSTAVFGASAAGTYAITVGTVNAGGITFSQSGYTLSSGSIIFNPVSAATGFVAATTNGVTGTVNSALAGTAGSRFTKTGSGTLIASGSAAITGGTAANPTVGTITGGTFNAATGVFDSVLQIPAGNFFGTAPTNTTTIITLDAGTLRYTQNGGNLLAVTRGLQVNAAGGAIVDSGTVGSSTNATINAPITDNAGPSSSLYLSNASGAFTKFTGAIGGTGGIVWNGLGTAVLGATNTYAGSTVVNKGTLQLASGTGYNSAVVAAGSLGSNTLTLAAGATLSLQGAVLRFDLGNSADRLAIQSGSVNVGGVNNVRLATGSSLAPGTYPLITTTVGSLTGSFEFDGGSTLTVPAASMVKQVGGTFYRLALQNSSTAEQVVVTPASGVLINEMPLGSSITEGVSAQGTTYTGGGYRSQLYQTLVNDGRFIPNFVGSNTVLDNNAAAGYNVLIGANQLHHEGHGGYTTTNILTNLNAGANWLTPGNGVNPDYVTLSIGGNDYGASALETTGPLIRTDAIVTAVQTLRPASHVVLSNLFYRTQSVTTSGTTAIVGDLQNTYYNPAVPGVVYNHILAGHHVSFVDQYTAVTPNNNVTNIGSDGIHPVTPGYNIMATAWYNTLAFGTAYWTGSQDNRWSTIAAGNATNFALNYPLTIPRQTALDAATDVYFNNNSAALPTVLGADLVVRSVNFAAGATGPVAVGGSNTLSINAGGITAQAGTGTHTISTNVALGADQTWGNVSANPLTVSGNISGIHALTTTGSYAIQVPVSATGNATVTQTFTGTGAIVLSGANTYTGGTLVSSGALLVSNASGSGTGTGNVNVASGATLSNNGTISGDVGLTGTANGGGLFGGAVTVNNGGVLNGAATISGAFNVGGGGTVMLTGGTLHANGGIVNNGTVRLVHGASLAVGGSGTFINNGVLDIISGSFSAPAGFTNNGVVIDSKVVQIKSVNRTGNTLAITINGYTGHSYRLQHSDTLGEGVFTNVGVPQPGTTGLAITFSDDISTSQQGFYRVAVDLD